METQNAETTQFLYSIIIAMHVLTIFIHNNNSHSELDFTKWQYIVVKSNNLEWPQITHQDTMELISYQKYQW